MSISVHSLVASTLLATTMHIGTSYGQNPIPNMQYSTTTRNVGKNLLDNKCIQRPQGTGSDISKLKIESEDTTGGVKYRFAVEVLKETPFSITSESAASMLAKVKSVFALSVSELSKIVGVERPTIYAWMGERATPHSSNLERLRDLFNLARQSEKSLAGLSDKQIKQLQIQDTDLNGLLSQTIIQRDLLLAGLENVRVSIEKDVISKQTAKLSLRDLAAKHGIPMPSKETSKDTFDLITGKRTNPELE